MRQAKLDPIHAAALVSTGSLVIYAPLYLALRGTRLVLLPLADVAPQIFFQGVVVSIVSLFLYGRAVVILGASGGSAFGALVPVLSALLAVPLVGEWPNRPDWLGIMLISAGVYLASGGPLPVLLQQQAHRARKDQNASGSRTPNSHSLPIGQGMVVSGGHVRAIDSRRAPS